MEESTKNMLKVASGIGVAATAVYLYRKGSKLAKGAKLNFAFMSFKLHKFDKAGMKFNVTLRIYNPSSEDITVALNQVVANYNNSAIAYSTPDIKGNTITAGSSKDVIVSFDIPYLTLIGKGLLANPNAIKQNLSFDLTLSVNGEAVSLTQKFQENMKSLGQLGIVSGPRQTRDGRAFNHLIKSQEGKDLFIKNGSVNEVVSACIDIVADHYKEVEDLAKTLKGGSLKETCANIFNFAYPYLQYHLDKAGTEELRTPARSWYDGQIRFKQQGDTSAGIDCDDFSIFCGSILKCLGIKFKFRITKYDGRANYQHIYVVVPSAQDTDGEIVIDPVLSVFDYQKPFSAEKSDFDMSPISLAGLCGFDGFDGLSGLGMPINVLSGLSGNESELMAIVSGVDFEDAINGLGDVDSSVLAYLKRTRKYIAANPTSIQNVQNPKQFLDMIDMAIAAWNTPQRDAILAKLEHLEQGLIDKGFIKPDMDSIEGLGETDEYEEYFDGVGRLFKRKRSKSKKSGGFFKRVGSAVKKTTKKVGGAVKKVGKALVRFNPLTIAMRGGLLAALRLNIGKMSSKLVYAYLPDNLASKYNIDPKQLAKLKATHKKVKKLFKGLQGKEENLRKAILKGSKKKSTADFTLKGDLGAVATAASVTAASGLIATIGKWLKPVKNLFSKAGRTANQVNRQIKQDDRTNMKASVTEVNSFVPKVTNLIEQYTNPTQAATPASYPAAPVAVRDNNANTYAVAPSSNAPRAQNQQVTTAKKGMSKKAKYAIGGTLALTALGAVYYFTRDNNETKKTNKKGSTKKGLGSINFQ